MKEFKQKAAEVTEALNNTKEGDGSSAIFNLNMHQDFIISKLGLQKRLKGHELIIKILLYKILGLKTTDEEMKKQISKIREKPRRSVMDSYKRNHNKSAYSENRSALHSYLKGGDINQKPGTHQGFRMHNTFYRSGVQVPKDMSQRDLLSQQKRHTNSLDLTSNRKQNKDLMSFENTYAKESTQMSPRSTIHSIIDQ